MENIFFNSWDSLLRTAVVSLLAYIGLVVLLRISGKRTLSKMNAFDLIVTVALGSTLANVLLNKDVALTDGLLAFFLLIYLQYLVTFISVRSKRFSGLVKSTPALLMHNGTLLRDALRRERVTDEEVYAALREEGKSTLATVSVVLETDGTLSVLGKAVESLDQPLFAEVKNSSSRVV